MRLIKNTTELIGIKDQNIKISLVFEAFLSYYDGTKARPDDLALSPK